MYLFIYLCIHLESTFVEIKPKKVILSLVVFTNIQIWMFLILIITVLAKLLKLYPKNENRSSW